MRILIVDDEYVCRLKLKTLLSPYGDCDAVPDGKVAMEFFKNAIDDNIPYDLVTLDVNMPELRGPETVKEIREMEGEAGVSKPVSILMITSKDFTKELLDAFKDFSASHYILKPVTPLNTGRIMKKMFPELEETKNA